MGWGTGNIGGGAALNFDIKAFPTEGSLPAAARENTIGVITEYKITGWALCPEEPLNPEEGFLWISTGTSSAVKFNVLKKNAVVVYPMSAKQYVRGKWIGVHAKSWQNGIWREWTLTLPVTAAIWNTATSSVGEAKILDDVICLKEQWISYAQYQQAITKVKYDVTPFSKLCARIRSSDNDCTKVLALFSTAGANVKDSEAVSKATTSAKAPGTIVECDISAVTGSYYIAVGQCTGTGKSNTYTYFDDVWME